MSKIKTFLFGGCPAEGSCAQIGYALFRLFVGGTMALQHGLAKIKAPEGFIDNAVAKLGLPMPTAMGWLAILAEFVGGICIALGLLTRPAAIFLGSTMAVAALMMHGSDPFAIKELALLYLACCIVIAFFGSGRFGIDPMLRKK
jgi:putative oxidoreductase